MGTHLRVLSESFPMNTNMTGFRWFSKIFAICASGESSLSIRRVIKLPGFNEACLDEDVEESSLYCVISILLRCQAMVVPAQIQNLQSYVARVVPVKIDKINPEVWERL